MLLHGFKNTHRHTRKMIRTYHIDFTLGGCCTHLANSASLYMISPCELLQTAAISVSAPHCSAAYTQHICEVVWHLENVSVCCSRHTAPPY